VSLSGGDDVLHRVMVNLLSNACEGNGSERAGEVDVFIACAGGLVHVEVADDGPGFGAAQLAGPLRAFASTKPGGTGLGLYTSERLVRASGGTLRADNRPGRRGARVALAFPEAAP
jgi:two-component system, NtrC family, C4-dicarboxylate transport sensor histidine kinase DctB